MYIKLTIKTYFESKDQALPLCVQTTRASRSAQLRLQNTRLEAARERQRLLRACTPSAQAARGCSLLVSTLCTIGAPRIYTCPYVNYTRDSYMEIKAQGLDFNEEKKKNFQHGFDSFEWFSQKILLVYKSLYVQFKSRASASL